MLQVVAGVLVRRNEVLACLRRPDQRHGGFWEFPGGKREGDETLEQCLRRELQEELAIDARVGRIVRTARHRYPGREPIELTFFHVPGYEGALTNVVFADIRWVPIGELSRLPFLEADRELVGQIDSGVLAFAE